MSPHSQALHAQVLFGMVVTLASASSLAASFDCSKARSKSERLICGDPQLSAMDDQLGALARAGKQRSNQPRQYQRALDDAWLVRQQCQDVGCVERWYRQRLAVLSGDAGGVASAAPAPPPKAALSAAPVPAVVKSPSKLDNVTPGAPLQVIGAELGFDIPLTKDAFLDRYAASGGACGASKNLATLQAQTSSAVSDCWSGADCPAPTEALQCKVVRTAYDGTGRLVLFSATLNTAGDRSAGARELRNIVRKFSALTGSEPQVRNEGDTHALSAAGTQGAVKLAAAVSAADGKPYVGVFSVAMK